MPKRILARRCDLKRERYNPRSDCAFFAVLSWPMPSLLLLVLGFNAIKQQRSYHGCWWRTCVSWLCHTSTYTTFFPKPPPTFLTCFSRRERHKYAGKTDPLNRVSNSQPQGHESDTHTTEPPGRAYLPSTTALGFANGVEVVEGVLWSRK